MRSKHLSVRKCIDKKPDKIKGIVCICINSGSCMCGKYDTELSDFT